jgi:hypothetical protein
MKQLIIVLAIFISAGLLPSCTQQTNDHATASLEHNTDSFKKDLGTAD